ncbi:MAG: peptidylprolyl isomerase [Phycisphaerales bacterium]|nr:peptidylprolyl isomerase [Phycisphaerales bacterium]
MPIKMRTLASVAVWCALTCVASAQMSADRLYNGFGRSVPATVSAPEGASGELVVRLYGQTDAGAWVSEHTAAAVAGRIDLATMFPVLWTGERPRIRYAQLFVGETPVGAPVVLQPMLTPERAELIIARTVTDPTTGQTVSVPQLTNDPAQGRVMFESEQIAMLRAAGRAVPDRSVTFSGIRAYVEQHVVLDTTLGEIELKMRPDAAPNTAFNFMHLVGGGFYTDIIFHRIVPRARDGSPFVIQVGDPTGGGEGGPGYAIDLEKSNLPHGFGVISMARSSDPDSNGSQVFICLSRAGTARLDGLYTTFGQTVRGGDVIQAIAATPVNEQGRAADPPVLRSARLVPAPPFGTGPQPLGEPMAAPAER